MNSRIVFTIYFMSLVSTLLSQSALCMLNDGNNVQIRIYANPILNVGADYLRTSERFSINGNPIGYGFSINLPPFAQNEGIDASVSLGVAYQLEIKNKIKMLSSFILGFHHISDLSGTYFNYGPKLDIFPGFYGSQWVVASHFSFDYRPFVSIQHKSYSDSAFQGLYEGLQGEYLHPKDGWYTQNLRFGNYGIMFVFRKERYNINFVLDYSCPLTELGFKIIPEIGMLPFNSCLGFNFRIVD